MSQVGANSRIIQSSNVDVYHDEFDVVVCGFGGAGGSGVVILRYPSDYTATYTSGVTRSTYTVGSDRVDIITATSNSSQTVTFAEA